MFLLPKACLVTLGFCCLSGLCIFEMQTNRVISVIFPVNWETFVVQAKGRDHTGQSEVTGSFFQLDHYCSFLFLFNFKGSSSGVVALTLDAAHVIL